MEQKEFLEHSAIHTAEPGTGAVEDSHVAQAPTEQEEAPPEVIALAGQVKEALAPVKAPPAVKDRLRVELVEVAQHRQLQDLRVEPPSRRREWAMGATIGSVVALLGGALYLLRSRLQGPSEPDGRSEPADSR